MAAQVLCRPACSLYPRRFSTHRSPPAPFRRGTRTRTLHFAFKEADVSSVSFPATDLSQTYPVEASRARR